LIIINAFVEGMIGLERTIFPKFAEIEFESAKRTISGIEVFRR